MYLKWTSFCLLIKLRCRKRWFKVVLFFRVHTGNDPAYSQRCGHASVVIAVQSQAGQNSGLISCHQTHFTFSDKALVPKLFTDEPPGFFLAAVQQLSPDFCSCRVEQISSSSSTAAPVNTGVKIPTCKFSMKEKFLTSPADLFEVFLNQEVSFSRRSAVFDSTVVQVLKRILISPLHTEIVQYVLLVLGHRDNVIQASRLCVINGIITSDAVTEAYWGLRIVNPSSWVFIHLFKVNFQFALEKSNNGNTAKVKKKSQKFYAWKL